MTEFSIVTFNVHLHSGDIFAHVCLGGGTPRAAVLLQLGLYK